MQLNKAFLIRWGMCKLLNLCHSTELLYSENIKNRTTEMTEATRSGAEKLLSLYRFCGLSVFRQTGKGEEQKFRLLFFLS
jgi:hypothetical protein